MELTFGTVRHLPHFAPAERALFVTFSTVQRWRLPPPARTITLRHVLWGHGDSYYVHTAVVMPDHVHCVLALARTTTLTRVMKLMKGVSARRINEFLRRRNRVWTEESFDHVIRSNERLDRTCEYVAQNPVRAGLVAAPDDYPWLWRAGIEGRGA